MYQPLSSMCMIEKLEYIHVPLFCVEIKFKKKIKDEMRLIVAVL